MRRPRSPNKLSSYTRSATGLLVFLLASVAMTTVCLVLEFGDIILTKREMTSSISNSGQTHSQVRLVEGQGQCEGRLEVLHEGSWGTVCDDDWDMADATVACRQLGCGLAVSSSSAFGKGDGPILLDNMDCQGREQSLDQCGSRGWGVHDCSHYEDVGIICKDPSLLSSRGHDDRAPSPSLSFPVEGSVRLMAGLHRCQGRVEVYHAGAWGTVCDDDWGLRDADVACQQAGCAYAVAATAEAFFGSGTGLIHLDNVRCHGNEPQLGACYSHGWGVHNCGHHEDAGVICIGSDATIQPPSETEGNGRDFLETTTVTDVTTLASGTTGAPMTSTEPIPVLYPHHSLKWTLDAETSVTDVTTAARETTVVSDDTTAARETTVVPDDTTAARETTVVSDDTTAARETTVVSDVTTAATQTTVVPDVTIERENTVVPDVMTAATETTVVPDVTTAARETTVVPDVTTAAIETTVVPDVTTAATETTVVTDVATAATETTVVPDVTTAAIETTVVPDVATAATETTVVPDVTNAATETTVAPDVTTAARETTVAPDVTTAAIETTVVPDVTTAATETTVLPDVATAATETTVVPDVTTAAIETTVVPDAATAATETTVVPDVTNAATETTVVPDVTTAATETTVVQDVTTARQTTVVPDVTTAATETTVVPDVTTAATETTVVPDVTTAATETTVVPDVTTAATETTVVLDVTTAATETTVVPDVTTAATETTVVPDVTTAATETTVVPDVTTAARGTTVVPDVTTAAKETTVVPDVTTAATQTTVVPDDTTAAKETTVVPDVTTAARETTVVPDVTTAAIETTVVPDVTTADIETTVVPDVTTAARETTVVPDVTTAATETTVVPDVTTAATETTVVPDVTTAAKETTVVRDVTTAATQTTVVPDEPTTQPAPAAEGAIRVVNGADGCQGRVELLHLGRWGTVCDDAWDLANARVACRQLGCGPALEARGLGSFGPGTGPILLDNVDCTGSEVRLEDCFHLGWGMHNCGHSEDAGVVCSSPESHVRVSREFGPKAAGITAESPTEGLVRLVNGTHWCEGRVEVFSGGQWGTVCDDAWDLGDARVVCRQLGCGEAQQAQGEALFGSGEGPILLNNLKCRGEEGSLLECSHMPLGAHNCQHSKDAGVTCTLW